MNNSNFGYGCRNNIVNCTFASINGELDEDLYLKKYRNPFKSTITNQQ